MARSVTIGEVTSPEAAREPNGCRLGQRVTPLPGQVDAGRGAHRRPTVTRAGGCAAIGPMPWSIRRPARSSASNAHGGGPASSSWPPPRPPTAGSRCRGRTGRAVPLDDPGLAGRLSEFFGRRVTVASTPPANATFDEVWMRDLKEGAEPYFGMPSRTEDGDELIDAGTFMSEHGNFFNYGAVHLVTTSTCRQLAGFSPESRFDPYRFLWPNVVIDTPAIAASWKPAGRGGNWRSARFGWPSPSAFRAAS